MNKSDWMTTGILGLVAALCLFLLGTSGAFPGESARMAVLLKGLEPGVYSSAPVFAALAKLTNASLAVPLLSGIVSVLATYIVFSSFLRHRFNPDSPYFGRSAALSRIGGVAAAVVLLFSPALIDSSTRLCAASFDLALAMTALVSFVGFRAAASARAETGWLTAASAITVVGLLEASSFFWLFPVLAVILFFAAGSKKNVFPWRETAFYGLAVLIAYVIAAAVFGDGPVAVLKRAVHYLGHCSGSKGWIYPLIFVVIPVPLILISSKRTLGPDEDGSVSYSHIGFTLLMVIAVFSSRCPYDVMSPAGVVPTFLTAAAACGLAYLVIWWLTRKSSVRKGVVAFLGVLFAISAVMNVIRFDPHRGDWADLAACRILDDLDGRTWLVSDGLLDDQLMLHAAERGTGLHLVSLKRDLDGEYLDRLASDVARSGIGGARNSDLVLSVRLGVLPFVRELLALPDAGKNVALFANPDLWYGSGREPITELLLVGAGDERKVDDGEYQEVPSELLDSPVMSRRLSFCANNRGVYLEDHDRADEAWKAYRRALTLWPENLSALMNCYGMARAGHRLAKSHLKDFEQQLAEIVADKNRRYEVWRLSFFCGYIRNPEACVRLGYDWARSGRVGEALAQLTRAIDLAPESRTNLMNLMASLYAQERDSVMSREVYRKILAEDAENHDALVGMMRLELADGNETLAAGYLERAAAVAGGGRLGDVERAIAMFVRGDREGAEKLLKAASLSPGADARTWSLRAATVLAELEAAKDPQERRRLRGKLEVDILKPMAEVAVGEEQYYLLVVKAFADMNGDARERKEARDALSKAALMRPASREIHEKLIALDITLADAESAGAHARNALRIDPKLSVANYALGSIALGKGEYEVAEGFLRKAVDTASPSVFAINDLAESCRRLKKYQDAVEYATRAVEAAAEMPEGWDTLAASLLDSGVDLERAESAAAKSVELSRKNGPPDMRSQLTLARIQFRRGLTAEARKTVNRMLPRISELSESERPAFDELLKNVR